MSYGEGCDGEGSRSVSDYVATHADIGQYKSFVGLETFHSPSTIHIAQGTSARHMEYVTRAVQIINEALPTSWHLRIGNDVPPLSATVPDRRIHVDFAPWDDWVDPNKPPRDETRGISQNLLSNDGERRAAHLWIDSERLDDRHMLKVVVHELLHALGLAAHIDRLDTILPVSGEVFWSDDPTAIYPVDREALLAVHTRLNPGDTPTTIYDELGDWAETSTHLVGQNEFAEFGIYFRSHLQQRVEGYEGLLEASKLRLTQFIRE